MPTFSTANDLQFDYSGTANAPDGNNRETIGVRFRFFFKNMAAIGSSTSPQAGCKAQESSKPHFRALPIYQKCR